MAALQARAPEEPFDRMSLRVSLAPNESSATLDGNWDGDTSSDACSEDDDVAPLFMLGPSRLAALEEDGSSGEEDDEAPLFSDGPTLSIEPPRGGSMGGVRFAVPGTGWGGTEPRAGADADAASSSNGDADSSSVECSSDETESEDDMDDGAMAAAAAGRSTSSGMRMSVTTGAGEQRRCSLAPGASISVFAMRASMGKSATQADGGASTDAGAGGAAALGSPSPHGRRRRMTAEGEADLGADGSRVGTAASPASGRPSNANAELYVAFGSPSKVRRAQHIAASPMRRRKATLGGAADSVLRGEQLVAALLERAESRSESVSFSSRASRAAADEGALRIFSPMPGSQAAEGSAWPPPSPVDDGSQSATSPMPRRSQAMIKRRPSMLISDITSMGTRGPMTSSMAHLPVPGAASGSLPRDERTSEEIARAFKQKMDGGGGGGPDATAAQALKAEQPLQLIAGNENDPVVEGCVHLCVESGLFGGHCTREQARRVVPGLCIRKVERYSTLYRDGSVGVCMYVVLHGSVSLKSFDGGTVVNAGLGACLGEEAFWCMIDQSATDLHSGAVSAVRTKFHPLLRLTDATAGPSGATLLAIPREVRMHGTRAHTANAPITHRPCIGVRMRAACARARVLVRLAAAARWHGCALLCPSAYILSSSPTPAPRCDTALRTRVRRPCRSLCCGACTGESPLGFLRSTRASCSHLSSTARSLAAWGRTTCPCSRRSAGSSSSATSTRTR